MKEYSIQFDDLIGVPFEKKGRGPKTYDCYGLVMECFRRRGIEIPSFESPDGAGKIIATFGTQIPIWKEVEKQKGTAVVIKLPFMMHVGYMVSDTEMIHCWERSYGVLVEPIDVWKRKVVGYYEYEPS